MINCLLHLATILLQIFFSVESWIGRKAINYMSFFLQVKTIVFDKTGTLTIGKPLVVSAVLFNSFSMEEVCDVATATEVGVTHIDDSSDRENFFILVFLFLKNILQN